MTDRDSGETTRKGAKMKMDERVQTTDAFALD